VGAAGKKEAQEKARQEREKRMADAELLAEKRDERAQTAGAAASTDAGAAPGAGTGVEAAAGAASGAGASPPVHASLWADDQESKCFALAAGAYLRALEARLHLGKCLML
jgi:hypothetical protein